MYIDLGFVITFNYCFYISLLYYCENLPYVGRCKLVSGIVAFYN